MDKTFNFNECGERSTTMYLSMSCCTERGKKWCTVVGAFLLVLTSGLSWYWGNLCVYSSSYIYSYTNEDSSFLRTPWTISLYLVFNIFGFIVSGLMANILGKRKVLFFGIVLNSLGMACTYCSIDDFVAFCLTAGVITGLGQGMVNGLGLQYVGGWAGNDAGTIVAIVQCSQSLCGLVVNQFTTLYCNWQNEIPDTRVGEFVLFSQPKVYDNVPGVFLFLGVGFLVISLVGLFLVFDIEREAIEETKHQYGSVVNASDLVVENVYTTEKGQNVESCKVEMKNAIASQCYSKDGKVPPQRVVKTGGSIFETEDGKTMLSLPDQQGITQQDHFVTEDKSIGDHRDKTFQENERQCLKQTNPILVKDGDGKHLTPLQALKTKSFYVLAYLFMAAESATYVVFRHYKLYGELWIHNDYFLTYLGVGLNVSAMVGRIVFGKVSDLFSIKTCMTIMFSFMSISAIVLYITPMLSSWMYGFNVSFYTFSAGIISTLAAAIIKIFGPSHCATIFGLTAIPLLVLQLITPFVIEALLSNAGWFSLFAYCGFPCAVGVVLNILFISH